MAPAKHNLGINVLDAARTRIAWTFDRFAAIYVSFSGGKDSTVLLHLVADESRRRGRRFGLLFIDLEAQYRLTVEHVARCYQMYADIADPIWVALPLHLRNAVSQFEPHWVCWEPGREVDWVRPQPAGTITDSAQFPFFRPAMEFEEFVDDFGQWYGQGRSTAAFIGIRTAESLNRWRTIASGRKQALEGKCWTTWKGGGTYNIYPIYDWQDQDLWAYHGKTKLPYNTLYDRMHQAGLTLSQMRICQPYGDDQRKGLWLYHLIEPETWGRVVARVNGANQGALYAGTAGNVLGNMKITKPDGLTWQEFAERLLASMPERTAEHYRNKIAQFLRWWEIKGSYDGVPDEADPKEEAERDVPSWRRICKALLRNDYWCKGLSFSQTKSAAYDRYLQVMKARRAEWGYR